MRINANDTAVVFIDPQNEVLGIPNGVTAMQPR